MTVNELITTLQSLPEEAKNNHVMVQTESAGNTFTAPLTQVYSVLQNQYISDLGIINQDAFDKVPDHQPNDLYSVKQDYELYCPSHTTFIYSEIIPEEKPEPTKQDLIIDTIREGNIPHLRVERD